MESRTKNTKRNIIFGLGNKFISIIFPFLTRTLFIYYLGKNYLGLTSLFTSLLQVLNLTELGIGSSLVYSMYKPIAEKDINKVSALLNFYKKCYKVIGFIVLVIGIVLLPFIKIIIKGDIPSDMNIYVIYSIYLLNSILSYFFFSYRQSVMVASQRNDIISNLNSIILMIQNILQIILLVIFKNFYLYILVLPLVTIINNFSIYFLSKKYFGMYEPKGKVEKEELNVIKKNISGLVFQKLGGIILSSVDNIVISAFLGLELLGMYNNYYYVISMLFGILSIFLESLKASVGNSIITESIEKNYKDFSKINFLYMWIVSWFTICFLCLIQNFILLWVGNEYLLDNKLVIVFALYFFIHKWCDITYVYQEASGLWWYNRYTQIIGAIVNLVLNLILVQYIGLYGILISTIISVLFVLDIGFCKVLFKQIFKNNSWLIQFIKKQLFYAIITVIAAVISIMLCNMLGNNLLMFIIKMLILIILPNIILYVFYFKSNEFKNSIDFIKSNIIKKRG